MRNSINTGLIWAQQLQVAAYGWWWHRRRFGKKLHRVVGELKPREKWAVRQFRDYQGRNLKHLLLRLLVQSKSHRRSLKLTFLPTRIHLKPYAIYRFPRKELLGGAPRIIEFLTQMDLPKGTIVFKCRGTTGTSPEIFYTPSFMHSNGRCLNSQSELGRRGS